MQNKWNIERRETDIEMAQLKDAEKWNLAKSKGNIRQLSIYMFHQLRFSIETSSVTVFLGRENDQWPGMDVRSGVLEKGTIGTSRER